MTPLYPFLSGAITMGFMTAGLFFLRFWTKTHDRLFVVFGAAFWLFAIERVVILCMGSSPQQEEQFLVYLFRLAGFIMILAGIVDKNRRLAG